MEAMKDSSIKRFNGLAVQRITVTKINNDGSSNLFNRECFDSPDQR